MSAPRGERGLGESEHARAYEGNWLGAALDDIHAESLGLACVAGIDEEEEIAVWRAPRSG